MPAVAPEIPNTPTLIGIEPNPTRPDASSIKVSVTIDPLGHYNVTSTAELPDVLLVIDCLPPSKRKLAERYCHYSIQETCLSVGARIPNSVWADAIVAATIRQRGAKAPAEASLELLTDAYIALNNTIYKLNPVGEIKTNNALAVGRKHIIDKAKGDAKFVLDAADKNAKTITKAALVMKARIDAERASKLIPPFWAAERQIGTRWDSREWNIGFEFGYQPKLIEFTLKHRPTLNSEIIEKRVVWKAVKAPAILLYMWQPIATNGTFSVTTAHSGVDITLPHIDQRKSCMYPGDVPKTIQTSDEFNRYVEMYVRCQNGSINLASMMHYPHAWHKACQEFLPPKLKEYVLKENFFLDINLLDPKYEGEVTVVNPDIERTTTWKV